MSSSTDQGQQNDRCQGITLGLLLYYTIPAAERHGTTTGLTNYQMKVGFRNLVTTSIVTMGYDEGNPEPDMLVDGQGRMVMGLVKRAGKVEYYCEHSPTVGQASNSKPAHQVQLQPFNQAGNPSYQDLRYMLDHITFRHVSCDMRSTHPSRKMHRRTICETCWTERHAFLRIVAAEYVMRGHSKPQLKISNVRSSFLFYLLLPLVLTVIIVLSGDHGQQASQPIVYQRTLKVRNEAVPEVEVFWVNNLDPQKPEVFVEVGQTNPNDSRQGDSGLPQRVHNVNTGVINTYIGHTFEVRELPDKDSGKCLRETCRKERFVVNEKENQEIIVEKDLTLTHTDTAQKNLQACLLEAANKTTPVVDMTTFITDCTTRPSTRCGYDWKDANNKCGVPCAKHPLPGWDACRCGELCFADLSTSLECYSDQSTNGGGGSNTTYGPTCPPTHNCTSTRCGHDWMDANNKCGLACNFKPNPGWEACKAIGEQCFADLSTSLECCPDKSNGDESSPTAGEGTSATQVALPE